MRETFVELVGSHLAHEVAFADDRESGAAKVLGWRPEIVFCDIGLPRFDGYQVAQALRAEPSLRSTLLVAMTGYGSEADKVRAAESGFDHQLTKPIDLGRLEQFLAALPDGGH